MHTGIPLRPIEIIGDTVFSENGYQITNFQGRLFLYKDQHRMAQLVDGYETLNKKFKNDFNLWIQSVRKKDIKKIQNIFNEIKDLEKQIKYLKALHEINDL